MAQPLAVLDHEVRLMPPGYVKAYVKRNKNDAADAEAICEAVTRPSMRFVQVREVLQWATFTYSGEGQCAGAPARKLRTEE